MPVERTCAERSERINHLSIRQLGRRLLMLFASGFTRRARAEQAQILAHLAQEDFPPSAILFGDEQGQADLTANGVGNHDDE